MKALSSFSLRFPKIFLLLLSAIFFLPFLGHVPLFDWDEINFAESAREMIASGDYFRVQIGYQAFWEKPPLFIWMQALSMHCFGINEFAARFPNALGGAVTLISLFYLGTRMGNSRFAITWPILYLASFLPYFYFRSGIIDPWFNLFIFLGVYHSYRYKSRGMAMHAALAGLFSGLAILTKGPVGLLLVLLASAFFSLGNRKWPPRPIRALLIFLVVCGAVSLFWFGADLIQNGPFFLVEFIRYQWRLLTTADAGHHQPLLYHFVVVLLGCFPISILALPSFVSGKGGQKIPSTEGFRKQMLALFWVVMILFTIVQTKIVHYSSMAYLPLSFLACLSFCGPNELEFNKNLRRLLLIHGLILGILFTGLPLVFLNKELILPYIRDPFTRDMLNTPVNRSGWESLPGLAMIIWSVMSFQLLKAPAQSHNRAMLFLFPVLVYSSLLPMLAGKVAAHSQGPAVEFFQAMADKDVYLSTVGYKSYAPLFYGELKPTARPESRDKEWLLQGPIDKDVYVVTKSHQKAKALKYPGVRFLYQKGGYAFFIRKAKGPASQVGDSK